jgi:hypothetical protein
MLDLLGDMLSVAFRTFRTALRGIVNITSSSSKARVATMNLSQHSLRLGPKYEAILQVKELT